MATPPSTAAPWDAPLDLGDHASALAAWQSRHAGREQEADARRRLAEIEERSGDVRVVHDAMAARGHYLRATSASREAMEVVARAPGVDVAAEVQGCRNAYSRAFRKYPWISNQGRVDDLIDLKPHPRSAALLDGTLPDPPADTAELDAAMAGSAYAGACAFGADAMASYALGDRCMAVGYALADVWPASARRALYWSAWFIRRYHADWTADLPASRWEPDGQDGFDSADAQRASLPAEPDPDEPPARAQEILSGRRPRSLRPAPETGEPRAFAPLFDLLLSAAPQLRSGERRWT